jgi:hypothetical protein
MARRGFFLSITVVAACGSETPEPPPDLTVEIGAPIPLGDGRARLPVRFDNVPAGAILEGVVYVTGAHGQFTETRFSDQTGPELAIDTGVLDSVTAWTANVQAQDDAGHFAQDSVTWTTGGPAISSLTPTVGDAAIMTVTGTGIGVNTLRISLGVRATPDGPEERIALLESSCSAGTCTGRVPVLLATAPQVPDRFPGAVPPATVYLDGSGPGADESFHAAVGTTQLVYRASPPEPEMGPAGSEFLLTIFHPARAPDLAGVVIELGDVRLVPEEVTEFQDLSVGGWIYLTQSRLRVPADATPGPHRLRVSTEHGEEMISSGSTFEVVATN